MIDSTQTSTYYWSARSSGDCVKTALITGVTGQDGAYLSKFLLAKGYEVHGIKRRSSLFNTARIDHIYEDPHNPHPRFILHYGDLTDSSSLINIVQRVQPDEIYNLGAQSHVQVYFVQPRRCAARRNLRDTQDHSRPITDQGGATGAALSR